MNYRADAIAFQTMLMMPGVDADAPPRLAADSAFYIYTPIADAGASVREGDDDKRAYARDIRCDYVVSINHALQNRAAMLCHERCYTICYVTPMLKMLRHYERDTALRYALRDTLEPRR